VVEDVEVFVGRLSYGWRDPFMQSVYFYGGFGNRGEVEFDLDIEPN